MPTSLYQAKTLFFIPLVRGAYILAVVTMFWNISIVAAWVYKLDDIKTTLAHLSNKLHTLTFLFFKFDRPAYYWRDNFDRFNAFDIINLKSNFQVWWLGYCHQPHLDWPRPHWHRGHLQEEDIAGPFLDCNCHLEPDLGDLLAPHMVRQC